MGALHMSQVIVGEAAFKALLERSGRTLACRLAISAICLKPDVFAGMALGYLGEGHTQFEPFYARFERERTLELMVGDFDVLKKRPCLFDTNRTEINQVVLSAGKLLTEYCVDTDDGFWRWRYPDKFALRWLRDDTDCAIVEPRRMDERVWLHVSAHLGTPAGLEP